MIPKKISRRAFIKSALAAVTLAGCTSPPPLPEAASLATSIPDPTATLTPAVPPTPPPSADGVIQLYLEAWAKQDYGLMYSLLSPESRNRITQNQFINSYANALNQTTSQAITTQVQSLLVDESTASANFQSHWSTILFGEIESDQVMQLRYDQDRWFVVWEPTLILPQLGHGVSLVFQEERPQRGLIYDSLDQALASHTQLVTIGVVPGQIEDEALVLSQLEAIVGLSADQIRQKMASARPDWFVPLTDMSFETSVQYHDTLSALAGVQRHPRLVRAYTQGTLAAHVLGTMGAIPAEQVESYKLQGYRGDELIGRSGVEGWGEPFLAGKRGGRLVSMSNQQRVLAEVARADPKPGGNVYLSINTELQARAEAILGNRRGAIVLLEPSGFIKAMASYPRYNPGEFATGINPQAWTNLLNDLDRPLVNRAGQGTYPPASVFKIVSMAAAIEHLGYSQYTPFFCSGSWSGLGPDFVKDCWLKTGHGNIDLQNGLTQSCDVVFYEVGLALHREDPTLLPNMARAFGLGQPVGLMGIDELPGVVPDNDWKLAVRGEPFFDGDAVNMAIGQGDILTTPLQIARMLATLANDGVMPQLQIIRRISSRDSGDQFFAPASTGTLPLAFETIETIKAGLFNVVHGSRGTAREAFAGFEFTAIGKTGTAESGGEVPHAWFAGYAPADEPEIVMVVILENAGEGSEQAAPLFRLMADSYFSWASSQS